MAYRDQAEDSETPAATGFLGLPSHYFGPPDGEDAIRADEMLASRIEAQAMGELRAALHDPETGFASHSPQERLAALPGIEATLDGIGETFRAQATTPRQRSILEPLLDNHLEHAATQVRRLANEALFEADDGIVEGRIGNLQQDAAVNWDDPARLRILGRAIVVERRAQGERKGWDKDETETRVRQNASDFYTTAIEAAIDKDLDRAGKLLTDARDMLLPERQVLLARKLAEAHEDRHVAGVAGTLAAIPLDAATPPNPETYRARAEGLTPDDASPELRARIATLADTAQRHAAKYWQHDRNQAGLAAIDWIVANPGVPVVAMDRKISAQLSPEQRARLQEIEATGRLDTDPGVYDKLDRLAVYDPKNFAAIDLSQYRLDLDGKDYARFTGFQKGDVAFTRYDRGRTVLDAGLIKAQFDPNGPEARAARGELDKTLRSFEAIEGRPPTMADIDHVAGEILATVSGPYTRMEPRGRGGPFTAATGDEALRLEYPPGRGVAPLVEPTSDRPIFQNAMRDAIGHVVQLPDGSIIPDDESPTGSVMGPSPHLAGVAESGRKAGKDYAAALSNPETAPLAILVLATHLGVDVGQAGEFDYQRKGNLLTGYTQLPHFRNVSNVNVGLICQQAGLSLHDTLRISGTYARLLSKNWNPNDPYWLDTKTRKYIEVGYRIGESGIYGPPADLPPHQ